jgi:hypothetical protein
MPRITSPGVSHLVWRVRYYADLIADALRSGHYGLAIRLGYEMRAADRALRRVSGWVILLVPLTIIG